MEPPECDWAECMSRDQRWSYGSNVEFGVLGPLQVSGERGPIDIAGVKERTLLAHLVACVGRIVTADELIDSLWGDAPPRTAAKSLQTYVLRLRNALEPDRHASPRLLVTDGPGYRLAVPDDAIDARRFARLVDLGCRAYSEDRADAAAVTLGEALALWRGPAYAGFEETRFGGGESRRLEELRLVALEDRIAADLDLGRAREIIPELESLVHEHPLRERLWHLLVLALYRSERQADALAAYGRARDIMIEELGVEPGRELRGLHAQVLAQDVTLLAPIAAPAVPTALLPPPGPFVGRDHELAVLRDAWTRTAAGQPVTVVLRGPHGSGTSRLVGELAVEVAESGCRVEYNADGTLPSAAPEVATLTVVAGRVAQVTWRGPPSGPRLTVVLGGPSTVVPEWAEVLDLPALAPEDVRTILGSYVDGPAVDEALPVVLRESGGIPGRVHDVAMGFARRRVAERVGEAAARTGQIQRALGAARDELREGVSDFRGVVERQSLPAADTCPWKGLAAYEVDDGPWFAGRERLVAELLARVATAHLLAVVGASGSGKSSLVHAGLVASLEAGALPGSEGWVQLVMRPGPHPMRELARVGLRGADSGRDRVADLLERLVYGNSTAGRVVLVVDQLEEAWTACADAGERAAFLDAIAEIGESDSQCTVVLVVRADYVGQLADQPVLARALADATALVGAPSEAEVQRAVQLPAERAGLHLDVGLADALVTDASGEPGSLPLLSTALTELWQQRDGRRLTLAAYVTAGGIRGAVARIAERAYAALKPDDQVAARILFRRLAGPGEGDAATRRRVPLAELAALPDRRVRAVVDPLAQARLLSVSADNVEVAHEALFREWPRLQAWLEEDAANRAVHRRLAVAAAEWDAGGREASELWRGTRLAAGTDLAAAHPNEVTDIELAFLEAGQAQHDAERRAGEERAAAATRQNRRLRWLLGGLGIVLVAATVAGTLAVRASTRAEKESRVATARELAAASVASLEADPERSILLALEAVDRTRSADGSVLPEAEEALHRAVVASRVVLSVPGVGGALDWSPDGSMFVTEGPEQTGVVDIRDAETGESMRSFPGHDPDVNDVAFSPDGSMLATTGDDGTVKIWDPATGEELRSFTGPQGDEGAVWGPSFSPDGSLLAASWSDEGFVRVWELATGRTVREIGPLEGPQGTSFSPDGTRLAMAVSEPPVAVVMDVTSGEEVVTLRGHEELVIDVEWSADGNRIATSSLDSTARIFDAETGHLQFTLSGHTGTVVVAKWSPDSTRLVTGSEDGTAKVWEITADATRELLTLSAQGTGSGVTGLAFSPDGDQVMTGEQAIKAAIIWDVSVSGDAEWANLPADPRRPSSIGFTPDSRLVASSGGGSVTVWNPETRTKLATMGSHGQQEDPPSTIVHEVDVSPDGALIATASAGETKVWDTATGEEVFTVHPGGGPIAWSPNGELLTTADGNEGVVEIVARSGERVGVLQEDAGFSVINARFSPDGRLLATARFPYGRDDPTSYQVKIWDWERGKVVRTIAAGGEGMSFDPGGTRIATADPLGPAEIWDVDSGHKLATLAGPTGGFWDVAFGPDGSRIAAANLDGTVRLWDAESAEQVLVLRGHTSGVFAVSFSPDGSKLASASADGTVRVWAIDHDDLIEIANSSLTRALSDAECRQFLHMQRCARN
jgi:WD40 repeat protein/DNA-binding SARP family transcriptional activator